MARPILLLFLALAVIPGWPSRAVAASPGPHSLRIAPKYLVYEAGQVLIVNKQISPSAAARTLQGRFLHGCLPACAGPTYTAMHPRGLYYEYSLESIGNAAHFLIAYLGSYYRSHGAAMAAMHSLMRSLPSGAAVTVCHPSRTVAICRDVMTAVSDDRSLHIDGTVYRFKWRLMVRENVLFEGGYALPEDDFESNTGVAGARLRLLTKGFLTLFS